MEVGEPFENKGVNKKVNKGVKSKVVSVKNVEVVNNGLSVGYIKVSRDFRKVENVKFCRGCGLMLEKGKKECGCGSIVFLNGRVAETLGGYIEMHNNGMLKEYFLKKQGKSGIRGMNTKRTIVWLLVHSDRLVKWDDEETIEVVYKAFRNVRNVRT